MPADVKTNLEPEDVHDLLLETFRKWVSFSLGVGKLGGKMLRHPSGRLAAALKAESDPDGNVVAIYVDEREIGAKENDFILHGHKGFSLKNKLLRAGVPGTRVSAKTGRLYRYVPISEHPPHPRQTFQSAIGIKNLFTEQQTSQGGIFRINRNLAKMWLSMYKKSRMGSEKIRTMSWKPGSARWYIPPMPAFNIQKLLKDALPKALKDRVIMK